MNKIIIIPARNEGQWADITATNFMSQFPEAQVIGIDDGGLNEWPDIPVKTTKGGIGVGMCRKLGVEAFTESDSDLICITDAHVLFDTGDKEKAWRLAAEGYIVNFSTKSLKSGKIRGNGRVHYLPEHRTVNIFAEEGRQVGLIGGVYFMRADIAKRIIAPTPNHGFNEEIMTSAALTFGYPIYTLPSMVFQHLYKTEFNYEVSYMDQQYNKSLLNWWFFNGPRPSEANDLQMQYHSMVQKYRRYTVEQVCAKFKDMLNIKNNKSITV